MYEAQIHHTWAGYCLTVVEVPLGAVLVTETALWLCWRSGHVLCGAGWYPLWSAGQWLFGFSNRHERRLWRTRLPEETVRRHFPASVLDLDG